MADIDIERKSRSPLPWVLGLLALALVAFLLMQSCGNDEPDDVDTVVVPASETTSVEPAAGTGGAVYGAPGTVPGDTFGATGAPAAGVDTTAP